MSAGDFRFGQFELDPAERQLRCDGRPIELNSRYLDVLTLLVSERGRLVTKDRFLDEVWGGIPVTDEALTQCIKTLRQRLGDDAANPRFIETVPKHGYRFIAPVGGRIAPAPGPPRDWRQVLRIGAAGTIGGGWAGLIGGLFYGFAGASQPLAPGMGAVSVLLVLTSLTILVALIGGAGVGFGIAAAGLVKGRAWMWSIIGGGLGGMLVGGGVKLLGLDAFNLLLGRSPGDITGAGEGLAIGAAVGLGAWLTSRCSVRRSVVQAALIGAAAGVAIIVLGGRLMAGSLALLAQQFPNSRLRLDQLGGLFGETDFGPLSEIVTGALEGALFAACVVGAMKLAKRG
jgi:DNA-binding winged helix-turn-helix (wHTH) protein